MVEDAMKNSKLISFLTICMFAAMLTGCNKEEKEMAAEPVVEEEKNMFGLTDSEQKMYAEYAAGVLMKYNAGSNMRVLEGQTLVYQEEKEEAAREQAARREQLAAEYASNKNQSSKKENQSSTNSSSGASQESNVSYISDMSAVTGTSAFTITYTGYEVADSYPASGEDILLAIDAGQGKVLLLTKFSVSNISGQTENFDMFSKQAKFKINLNGTSYKSQYTLLLDDLSMYIGDIDAKTSVETVLVFEIPESEASSIGEMTLNVTTTDGTGNMQLRGGTVSRTETAQSVESEMEDTNDSEENDLMEEEFDITETEDEIEDEAESDESGNVTVVGSNSN